MAFSGSGTGTKDVCLFFDEAIVARGASDATAKAAAVAARLDVKIDGESASADGDYSVANLRFSPDAKLVVFDILDNGAAFTVPVGAEVSVTYKSGGTTHDGNFYLSDIAGNKVAAFTDIVIANKESAPIDVTGPGLEDDHVLDASGVTIGDGRDGTLYGGLINGSLLASGRESGGAKIYYAVVSKSLGDELDPPLDSGKDSEEVKAVKGALVNEASGTVVQVDGQSTTDW